MSTSINNKAKKVSETTIKGKKFTTVFNEETKSLSGLIRLCKSNEKINKYLVSFIDEINKDKETNISINQVLNTKNICNNATERELYKNAAPKNEDGKRIGFERGERKEFFTASIIERTAKRLAKLEAKK